jgi:glycosyltransferase involved in cell wall biosynthesis
MLLQGGTAKISNTRQPTVSVVIVTFNAAQTLQACLNSIYGQEYPAIEIVVVDGQSTDGTIDLLKVNDERIHYWRSEKDAGIYDAMNKALQYIKGEWVYFLGADDTLLPGFSKLAGELKDRSVIYYGRVQTFGGPTFPVNAYQFAKIGICHQAMIYPKGVFDHDRFDTRYRISADYAFNIPLFQGKKYHFEFRNHLVANFNHTGVSSLNTDQAFEADRSKMVLKYFGMKIWLRFLFWRAKQKKK